MSGNDEIKMYTKYLHLKINTHCMFVQFTSIPNNFKLKMIFLFFGLFIKNSSFQLVKVLVAPSICTLNNISDMFRLSSNILKYLIPSLFKLDL